MRYLSWYSGIEAATLAWEPLGWEPMAFAELEAFPSAVLEERWPHVPNLGDVTKVDWLAWVAQNGTPDVMVAGSPCQAFSVAGNRDSLEDARGNLTLLTAEFVRLVNPRYFIWENVPGVLTTSDNAFGCFLGELVGAGEALRPTGKRWSNTGLVSGPEGLACWRVLDAQYFGVAQRRRRVFLARCPRGGADPAQVLLESSCLHGHPAPSREARQTIAGCPGGSSQSGGFRTTDLDNSGAFLPVTFKQSHYTRGKDGAPSELCQPLTAHMGRGSGDQDPFVLASGQTNAEVGRGRQSRSLRAAVQGSADCLYPTGGTHGVAAGEDVSPAVKVGSGLEIPSPPAVAGFIPGGSPKVRGIGYEEELAPTLNSQPNGSTRTPAVVVAENQRSEVRVSDTVTNLNSGGGKPGQGYPAVLVPEVADPISASEGRTYTHEGINNFRTHNVVFVFSCKDDGRDCSEDISPTMRAMPHDESHANAGGQLAVTEPTVLEVRGRRDGRRLETRQDGTANCLRGSDGGRDGINVGAVHYGMAVRRLTPRECERLQGMPDDHTLVPWRGKPASECPDGPRYKAIGNSMAVPVVRWIGERIQEQERR